MLKLYKQEYASVRSVAILIVGNNARTVVFLFQKLIYRFVRSTLKPSLITITYGSADLPQTKRKEARVEHGADGNSQ